MTSKRSLLKLTGWSTLAAAAALVGCGKKEEAAAPAATAPAEATEHLPVTSRNLTLS